ncbi:MAG: hypothetical protein Q7V57_03195 [Actinomycetota bacterium]|nr:hypothetical protein [Actinomycetota bacterium]
MLAKVDLQRRMSELSARCPEVPPTDIAVAALRGPWYGRSVPVIRVDGGHPTAVPIDGWAVLPILTLRPTPARFECGGAGFAAGAFTADPGHAYIYVPRTVLSVTLPFWLTGSVYHRDPDRRTWDEWIRLGPAPR